mmetsp:Transcript_31744/g.94749  ORF Transcript_31744/g.94749 Transcript_31744/m.94749 type:complete len:251 (+) Transcript_31744:322-1074(+)
MAGGWPRSAKHRPHAHGCRRRAGHGRRTLGAARATVAQVAAAVAQVALAVQAAGLEHVDRGTLRSHVPLHVIPRTHVRINAAAAARQHATAQTAATKRRVALRFKRGRHIAASLVCCARPCARRRNRSVSVGSAVSAAALRRHRRVRCLRRHAPLGRPQLQPITLRPCHRRVRVPVLAAAARTVRAARRARRAVRVAARLSQQQLLLLLLLALLQCERSRKRHWRALPPRRRPHHLRLRRRPAQRRHRAA